MNNDILVISRSFFQNFFFLGIFCTWRFHGVGPYRDEHLGNINFRFFFLRKMILTIDGSFKFSWLARAKNLDTVCLVYNSVNLNKIYNKINLSNPLTISRNQKIDLKIQLYKKFQNQFPFKILTNKKLNHKDVIYYTNQSLKHKFFKNASCFVTINQFGTWSNSVIESLSYNLPILILKTDDQSYNLGPFYRFGVLINFYIASKTYFECCRVNKHINKKLQIKWKEIHLKQISYLSNHF